MKSPQKKALFTLFLVVATELIGFGLIIPVLPQIASKFESNHIMIGILMGAYSIAQFIAAPILGALSDKYGRKPILIASKIGTIFGYVVMAMATNYWLFLLARLIDGFTGGNISVARAYVADVTPKEERSKGMAIIGIAFGTGFIFGPALGGLLYGTQYGHSLAAIVAGSLSLIALLFTIFLLKEPEKRTAMAKESRSLSNGIKALSTTSVKLIVLCYFIYMLIFSGFETTFALFNAQAFHFTEKQNSLVYVFAGILGLLIQGGISRKKVPFPKNAVLLGFTSMAIGFAGFSISQSITFQLSALCFFALGIACINTYLPTLLTLYTKENNRGLIMGLYEGIGSLSRAIGPLLAFGLVMPKPRMGYFSYAVLLGILGLIIFKGIKKSNTLDPNTQ